MAGWADVGEYGLLSNYRPLRRRTDGFIDQAVMRMRLQLKRTISRSPDLHVLPRHGCATLRPGTRSTSPEPGTLSDIDWRPCDFRFDARPRGHGSDGDNTPGRIMSDSKRGHQLATPR